jgi:hypothetical protein
MVRLTIADATLEVEVEGLDKLWSLRSVLRIPLAHVRNAHATPDVARRWFDGIKLAGSYVPGVITAGTFHQDGGLVFWDVHHPENAIAIELEHEQYRQLIVEVADVPAALALIQGAVAGVG